VGISESTSSNLRCTVKFVAYVYTFFILDIVFCQNTKLLRNCIVSKSTRLFSQIVDKIFTFNFSLILNKESLSLRTLTYKDFLEMRDLHRVNVMVIDDQ
jgi:hypothetical protein